ncbi:hypothetical protein GH714_010037 [Hevea brasiliensis]|uniref:Uncharacterized protein n=1 Tax=Hevea brasiliensis TaxID=3981 RepID=A0A6A6M7G6_HEVBR|nr:hypothetical protein GH714_010037 [Hevea brasiliensis]
MGESSLRHSEVYSDVAMKDDRNFVVIAEVARNHTGKVINEFCHVKRKINVAGHMVSQLSDKNLLPCNWVTETPSQLALVLAADASGVM